MCVSGSCLIRKGTLLKGFLLAWCVAVGMLAHVSYAEDIPGIPDAKKVGQGDLHYAIWHVYTASLYAPRGVWKPGSPMALRIQYHVSLEGKKIADRSIHEIKQQSSAHASKWPLWQAQLKKVIPNVKAGTILSAVFIPGQGTYFYKGHQVLGSISGDDFGVAFFDIWLASNTSEPALRRALLSLP